MSLFLTHDSLGYTIVPCGFPTQPVTVYSNFTNEVESETRPSASLSKYENWRVSTSLLEQMNYRYSNEWLLCSIRSQPPILWVQAEPRRTIELWYAWRDPECYSNELFLPFIWTVLLLFNRSGLLVMHYLLPKTGGAHICCHFKR